MGVKYVDTNKRTALNEFSQAFYDCLKNKINHKACIVLLCIGTDRITGDCLGPMTGYKLQASKKVINGVHIYGTLKEPVHAKNLVKTINMIHTKHKNPLIVAIDSSLGQSEHIGHLTIGEGSLKPGAGVNKELPAVGDIFITGIVNFSGIMDIMILQNTRLHLVMEMSDIIYNGVLCGLLKI